MVVVSEFAFSFFNQHITVTMGKTDEEIAAKKAAKKARKEKAKAAEDGGGKKEKKDKKDKKDKKRQKEGDSAADDKSSKKAKSSSAPAAAATSSKYAAVGDRALADRSEPFKRDFYTPAASVTKLSAKEVAARREELGITLELAPPGANFTPVAAFNEAGFPKNVLAATASFQKPSPIQAQSWPIVMSGHDMVGIAATGSGKTMAFGLPALVQILSQPAVKPGQPICLVLGERGDTHSGSLLTSPLLWTFFFFSFAFICVHSLSRRVTFEGTQNFQHTRNPVLSSRETGERKRRSQRQRTSFFEDYIPIHMFEREEDRDRERETESERKVKAVSTPVLLSL